jgi:copper chaperone
MSQTIEFKITGMTCDHCVRAVTGAVEDVPGVSSVSVSLENNSATVEGESIDTTAVIEAIKEEGYEAAVS